jgi:hypothetical protein
MGAAKTAIERLIAAVADFDRAPDVRELAAAAVACQPITP